MGFSPEVLPVVSVFTECLVVLCIVRTPFSFEIVHVEVKVFVHLVDQSGFDLLWRVRERTIFPILASIQVLGVPSTKSSLVFLNVV